jgi:hypothetical protein
MSTTRAALLSSTSLLLVLHGVHHFQQRWQSTRATTRSGTSATASIGSLSHSDLSNRRHRARAASSLLILSLASRTLTLQLALGLGTVGGLGALVLAIELFADWSALGFGSDASGVATSRLADSLALRAASQLTEFLGATDGANGAFAMDGALSAGNLLTLHLALGASAHRVAHGRASGVVALPFAHGVALFSGGNSQQEEKGNKYSLHLSLMCFF